MFKPKRRWSDNDRHFGPFTLSRPDNKRYGLVIDSGHDENPGCHLRLYLRKTTLLIELPAIIPPSRKRVEATYWDDATVARIGRNWYWNESPREYGFSISDGFLQIFLGRQTMDSSTTQDWCCFLPWTQWRHVRHTLYGLDGFFVWAQMVDLPWGERAEREESCPSISFEFDDYDGERITAKTRIEEREWLFGEGWFKWLSLFRKPMVRRSLNIQFSSEVGPKKGSWKGGTVGHGIDMEADERHEEAFRQYCSEHNLTFVATVSEGQDHD